MAPPPLLPINQPPESRFAGLLKPFFDSIDPQRSKLPISRTCVLLAACLTQTMQQEALIEKGTSAHACKTRAENGSSAL